MALAPPKKIGIGMTSLRTRERMLTRLREQGIKDEVVLHAMGEIPRHIFVDDALSTRAYEDVSLPIGFAQTISQPYIVARMTEVLRNGNQLGKVLEIGTGC
jgi:protein-L-isoaspartate(D-aspartate) O-methyltransferase